MNVNTKNRKTLENTYKLPVSNNILWSKIENLFISLGAEISEGAVSRIRVKLNGVRAVFHRPHPERVTHKGAVNSVKRFLENAGVEI